MGNSDARLLSFIAACLYERAPNRATGLCPNSERLGSLAIV